jgi:plastocyanin
MVGRRTVALALLPMLALLALPVLAAAPAAAGGFCHEPVIDDSNVPVDAKDDCFFPSVVHVRTGTEVTFNNRDDVEHTVTGQGGVWGGDLPVGQKLNVRFDRPGVFPYFCHIHIGMIGAAVVTDSASPLVGSPGASVASTTVPVAAASNTPLGEAEARLAASRSTRHGRGTSPILLDAGGLAVLLALAAGIRHRRRAASS